MSLVVRGAPDDLETEDYRVWARRASTPAGDVTVYVGDSLESVHEATTAVRRALLLGLPATLALLVAGTWVLVGRALRPVDVITSQVASISEDRLDRRVPVPPADDEVGRLARTMNDMLDRLDVARGRERAFVADASHELLSPLAASRAHLEVGPGPGQDWEHDVVPTVLAENSSMEALVRDLLYLARADQEAGVSAELLVDLDDLVLEEAARLRPISAVMIDTSGVSAAPVRGDPEELRRLVRNLVENAARHAAELVRLTLRIDGGQVRLDIMDDGPGVDPAVGDRVFDRFFRADPARARSAGGSGLGLAIARAVAERHHGSLTLARNSPGAHFVLTLPVAPS